jgi:hypothetical protein
VDISQANAGLIRRDLRDQKSAREKLATFSTTELLEICRSAADRFLNDPLYLGDELQSPEDYVRHVSGLPACLMSWLAETWKKIHDVLAKADDVLNGLTRNIDFELLDRGFGDLEGKALSFYPRTDSLGSCYQATHLVFIRYGCLQFL